MQRLNYQVIKSTIDHPFLIEVSALLEKMVRHGLKQIDFPDDQAFVEPFDLDGQLMLRFICAEFPENRFDEFSWYLGEWYVRNQPLLKVNMN